MSIIIRLQNLPWDASAISIRQFFQGLSIPSGGVHIVGGEKGDAFIAFTNDEDARLAMGKNGEMIGTSVVKLFLSSKTEMQNVINQARKGGTEEIIQVHSNMPFPSLKNNNNKNQQFTNPEVHNYMGQNPYRPPNNNFNNSNMFENKPEISNNGSRNFSPNRKGYTSLDFSVNSYNNQDPFNGNATRNNINQVGNRFTSNTNERLSNNGMLRNREPTAFPLVNEINQSIDQRNTMIRPGGGFQNQNHPLQMPLNHNQNKNSVGGIGPQHNIHERPVFRPDFNNRQPDLDYKQQRFYNESFENPNISTNVRIQFSDTQRYPIENKFPEKFESNLSNNMNKNQPRKPFSAEHIQNMTSPVRHVENMNSMNIKPADSHGIKRSASMFMDFCVIIENLPKSFNYREIRNLFFGSEIDGDGIKIINDEFGKRMGRAYVRFRNRKSLEMGMRQDRSIFEGMKISIHECSDLEFTKAIDSFQPSMPRGGSPRRKSDLDYCVIIKKLPLNYTVSDIKKLLGNVRYAKNGGPHIELTRAGKSIGNALIELDKRRDYDVVLAWHREKVRGETILVIPITRNEYKSRVDASQNFALSNEDIPVREKGDAKTCVMMRGLPFEGNIQTIKEFFRGISIVDGGIHLALDHCNRPNGVAYVEFETETDCAKAKQKDKEYIGRRYIDVIRLTKKEMLEELSHIRKANKFSGEKEVETYVYMRNLSDKTQLDDIMTFFRGYYPILDSIKLQYKDDKPTGDGLVAFASRREAEEVVNSCYRKPLLDHFIELELWEH